MLYRNQITEANHLSLNYTLDRQLQQKYQAHLNKIFQIENRIVKPNQQAKLIQRKINELTKLKQFARNFKAKEQQLERSKNDIKMIKNINQMTSTTDTFKNDNLTRTSGVTRFNCRIINSSSSMKKIGMKQLPKQVKNQNQRLIKSISEKSFDQSKFRKTLRSTTKDYLKIREHMRRIKGERISIKKLKTQPDYRNDGDSSTKNIIQNMNEEQIKQFFTKINNKSQNLDTINILSKRLKSKVGQSLAQIIDKKNISKAKEPKKLFTIKQNLTQIILKKL